MLSIGIVVMVLGTYANLYAIEEIRINPTENIEIIPKENLVLSKENKMEIQKVTAINLLPEVNKNAPDNPPENKPQENSNAKKEIRHEPPQPEEPPENVVSAKIPPKNEAKPEVIANVGVHEKQGPVVEPVLPESENEENMLAPEKPELDKKEQNPIEISNDLEKKVAGPVVEAEKKTEEVDIEAIKKEDVELKEQEKSKEDALKKQIDTLKKQNEVQMQIVQQQQQILEVIKQQHEVLVNEKQKEEIEKVQQKKLEAVKQIESIAKQAIESLGVKDTKPDEKKNENKSAESKLKNIENMNESRKLVPLPLAVSNNLTIDGKLRGDIKEKAAVNQIKPSETVIKENEFNINQVDKMNINIKHEINLNVDGQAAPKNLVELLNGKPNMDAKEKKNDNNFVKNDSEKNINEHVRSERSVEKDKNNAPIDFVLNKSDSPLAEIVNKLSEASVAALKDINNVAPGRDLKYIQAKM